MIKMLHNASALRTVLPWTSSVNTATTVPDISSWHGQCTGRGPDLTLLRPGKELRSIKQGHGSGLLDARP